MDQVLTIARYTNNRSVPAKSRCSGRKYRRSWLFPLFPSIDLIVQEGYWSFQLIRLSDTVEITGHPTLNPTSHPAHFQCSYLGVEAISLVSYSSSRLRPGFMSRSWHSLVISSLMSHTADPSRSAISADYSPKLSNMPTVPHAPQKFPFFHQFLLGPHF